MAVKIRLQRRGAKKAPFYAIVAADIRAPRDGRYLEKLGTYNPLVKEDQVSLKPERVSHWLGQGAVPTTTVARLLKPFELSAAS